MRYRSDSNMAQIIKTLRNAGASVFCTSALGHGFPDLVIGWSGSTILAEVKNLDGRGLKLTSDEENFFRTWKGNVHVITSIEDALALLDQGG